MKEKSQFSRRDFMKSSALASTAILGAGTIVGCSEPSTGETIPLRQFLGKLSTESMGVTGLLFSQLGYEPNLPIRVVVRLPERLLLSDQAVCSLVPENGEKTIKNPCTYWGELWGSHWWIAEFASPTAEGEYAIEVLDGGSVVYADSGLLVKKGILWDSTIEWSSVDMLERRKHFTKVGAGWQDAGSLWVESPAQSGMVISLEELLEKSRDKFDAAFIQRIYDQIIVGCDYLVMTQKKAKELGYADGTFTHDLHGHEHDILPNDANKAVVALMRAVRLLPDEYQR
ncbi:MAG: hypothetical protein U5K79_13645 [Cyclobacteriaceae bacterium]|nr:hypothetical protein [Cyclobacteriaceae bacterium]